MTTNIGNDEETWDGGGKTPKKDRKLALLNGYLAMHFIVLWAVWLIFSLYKIEFIILFVVVFYRLFHLSLC